MDAEKIEHVNSELKNLEKVEAGIVGAALVNRNGLLLTSRLPLDIDGRKFGAMAVTMFNAMETATTTMEKNELYNITAEYNNYQVVALVTNKNLILVTLLHLNINLGLCLIEIEESIKRIQKILI